MFLGVGEMAQLVKCLPTKHEDLSLISRTHVKCHMVVAFVDNLRAKEAETRGSLGLPGQQNLA